MSDWTNVLWLEGEPWDKQPLVIWAAAAENTEELVQRVRKETGIHVSRRSISRELTRARQRGMEIPNLRFVYGTAKSGEEPKKLEAREKAEKNEAQIRTERKLAVAKGTLEQERRRIRILQKELHNAQSVINFRESAEGFGDEIIIKPPKKVRKSLRVGCPIVMASDWHVEETVDPIRVNYVNEYNTEVAERRAARFFQGATYKCRQAAKEYTCEQIILWAGGDFITGFIHECYKQTNTMSPTQAVRFWKTLFRAGIEMMLEELPGMETLNVVCNYGNHGRTTRKPVDSSIAAANSFEYAAYLELEDWFADNPRVKFSIAAGTLEYVSVYDWLLRFTHGDKGIKYRDAIGGISTAARKAVMGWDTSRKADYTIAGHWHQWLTPFSDIIFNGSLVGYNPFAMDIKARWEPPQQGFWILDAERGRRHTESIWVSSYGAKKPV